MSKIFFVIALFLSVVGICAQDLNYDSFNNSNFENYYNNWGGAFENSLVNIPQPIYDHDCFRAGINVQWINDRYRAFCRSCSKETSVSILPAQQNNSYQHNNNYTSFSNITIHNPVYVPCPLPQSEYQFQDKVEKEKEHFQEPALLVTTTTTTTTPRETPASFSEDRADKDEISEVTKPTRKRTRASAESSLDSSVKGRKKPVFRAFIRCAYEEQFSKIVNKDTGEISITNEEEFIKCTYSIGGKLKPTSDINSRRKSFKQFVTGYPKKNIYSNETFSVFIKDKVMRHKSSGILTSHLLEFKALVAEWEREDTIRPEKRPKI